MSASSGGSVRLELTWPWESTNVYGRFCRLNQYELAHEWGEATWTAPDLWKVGRGRF